MGFWSNLLKRRATPSEQLPPGSATILGYTFHDTALLNEALTHRSYANTNSTTITYERLEFLGDSVLGLLVARSLFKRHPSYSEGELTKAKAALVNIKTLTKVAKREGLGRYVKLSPEEDRAGGRERASILSDVLEAVIGAVYLEGGIGAATELIERILINKFAGKDAHLLNVNSKGDLLEHLQGEGQGLPRYEVVNEEGPDHEKVFTVAVMADGREVGRGVGSNKKEAEQQAAREALQLLCKDSEETPQPR
jgi:ribonuclease-3